MAVEPFPNGRHLAFKKGQLRYSRGLPCPPRPADENDDKSSVACEYIGWMMARAVEWARARSTRERTMLALGLVPTEYVAPPTSDRGDAS